MRSSTASSRCGEPACSTRGVCDEWAGTCDCPIGFSGARCEVPVLPACMLGDHAIPIRSWILHAFHDSAGHWRSPPGTQGVRDLGPVPCGCLQQLVAAPFLLERTRLQYMRGLVVRCAELPPDVSLAAFVERPVSGVWRHFSFAAAYDALRLGVEPSLHGEPLDAEQPWLPELLRAARDPATLQLAPTPRHVPAGEVEVGAGWLAKHLVSDSIPPLVSRAAAATDSPPLLPLARCAARCGGVGWCEPTERGGGGGGGGGARCGCFLPGGLVFGTGGEACGETRVWEAASQPVAHWGPPCPLGCGGHGRCDWQGFCRCNRGFWGLDCAVTWGGKQRQRPVISLETIEQSSSSPPPPPPPSSSVAASAAGGASRAGAGSARRRKHFRPKLYVHTLPALLRFGVDFAANVDAELTERLLRSAHRAATPAAADYIYVPGPPLVVDGHRLLARLFHVFDAHGGWNRTTGGGGGGSVGGVGVGVGVGSGVGGGGVSGAGGVGAGGAGRARFIMALLTERASMDSFQVSYSDEDREEWPSLADAPHVRRLRAALPTCFTAPPATKPATATAAGLRGRNGRQVRLDADFVSRARYGSVLIAAATGASGARARARTLLRVALEARRHRQRARLLGELVPGGYISARGDCRLPPEIEPSSATRRWLGLQFNGNRAHPVNFQPGKDVVLPQLLLLRGGGSHADQPSCERMNATSPFSAHFDPNLSAGLHHRRRHLLWFGGHGGHDDARSEVLRRHRDTPGFALLDTMRTTERRDAVNGSNPNP